MGTTLSAIKSGLLGLFGAAIALAAAACGSGTPNNDQATPAPYEKPTGSGATGAVQVAPAGNGGSKGEDDNNSGNGNGSTADPGTPLPGTGTGTGSCSGVCGETFTCATDEGNSSVTFGAESEGQCSSDQGLALGCDGTVKAGGQDVGTWTKAGSSISLSLTDGSSVTCTKK